MLRTPVPTTTGTRFLRSRGIPFVAHSYEEHGGTRHAALEPGIVEDAFIKTLVFETSERSPVLFADAREAGGVGQIPAPSPRGEISAAVHARRCATPATQREASARSERALPIDAERTIVAMERVCINGGTRGVLVEMAPGDRSKTLPFHLIDAATAR